MLSFVLDVSMDGGVRVGTQLVSLILLDAASVRRFFVTPNVLLRCVMWEARVTRVTGPSSPLIGGNQFAVTFTAGVSACRWTTSDLTQHSQVITSDAEDCWCRQSAGPAVRHQEELLAVIATSALQADNISRLRKQACQLFLLSTI